MSEENNKQPLIENNDAQEQTTETGANDIKESIVVETPDQASNPSSPSKCQCFLNILYRYIPITEWIQSYNLDKFRYDFIAGLTVGIMVIPQGMAYAMLANLPPIYGLYSCLFPVMMYGILGTSRQAHIGPFALVSMLVGSTVSAVVPASDPPSDEYINATLLLSLLCGCFLLLLGVARFGFITALLSETVITSFTASSAFNIGGSQLKHYVGATVKSDDFLHIVIELFSPSNIQKYNYCQLILGITATLLLYVMKKLNKRFLSKFPLPNELFLVIIFTFISWVFDLKGKYNIKILGDQDIPSGAIIIGIITYVITYSMGKIFARKHNYHVDENQELIALGVSNIVGSLSSSYPSAGSLSRTALIDNLQSQTPFHNFISPLVIIITLYTLTGVVKYLPNSTLAAVVEVNLISLFKQLGEIVLCYKTDLCDFFTFLFCTVMNICFGTEIGLVAGVCTSFVSYAIQMIYSYIKYPSGKSAEPETEALKANDKYVIYNASCSVMFLNRQYHIKRIEKLINTKENQEKTILLDFSRVKYMDISAFISFSELLKNHSNVLLYVTNEQVIAHMNAYKFTSPDYHIIHSLSDLL